MSETMRIRLGLKTHKGTLGDENADRFLIGMDPASNDWLYSPDEISIGEFGTLILLASGLHGNENGSKAANLVTHTIRKLFDEMLEIPPDQEGLISLLRKFFIIANQQLILKSQENPDLQGLACSASMVLIKDDIAYVVWVGNCRVYRYAEQGVRGSFFCKANQLEQLNLDHKVSIEKILLPNKTWPDDLADDQLTKYFGLTHELFSPSVVALPIHQGEKILVCTKGLFEAVEDLELEKLLAQDASPDVHSEDLIGKAFNNNTKESISVIVTEILHGHPPVPLQRQDNETLKNEAIKLLGYEITMKPPVSEVNQDQSSGIEPGTKDFQSDIKPMRVRTVLPDGSDSEEPISLFTPSTKKSEPEPELQIPLKDKSSKISAIENALKKEQLLRKLTPSTKKEKPIDQEDNKESKGKPRIMATAYPDPEDGTDTKRTEVLPSKGDSESNIQEEEASDAENHSNLPISENEAEILYDESKSESSPSDPDQTEAEDNIDTIDEPNNQESLAPEDLTEAYEKQGIDNNEAGEAEDLDDFPEVAENSTPSHDPTIDLYDDEEVSENQIVSEIESISNDKSDEDLIEPSIYDDYEPTLPKSNDKELDGTILEDDLAFADEETIEENEDTVIKNDLADQKTSLKDDAGSTSNKRSKPILGGVNFRIGIILIAIILLGIFICNQQESNDLEDLGLDRVTDKPKTERKDKQDKEESVDLDKITENKGKQESESPNLIPPPEEKPKQEKKEEKTATAKEEKEPNRLTKEPEYDEKIKENKTQLVGEVEALLKQKNTLCRQINTYRGNAPSSKQSKIESLLYDCDQLDKKFSTIYDTRSGFFRTNRYDFLNSTIKNIRFSIEQTEKKFEEVRSEQ